MSFSFHLSFISYTESITETDQEGSFWPVEPPSVLSLSRCRRQPRIKTIEEEDMSRLMARPDGEFTSNMLSTWAWVKRRNGLISSTDNSVFLINQFLSSISFNIYPLRIPWINVKWQSTIWKLAILCAGTGAGRRSTGTGGKAGQECEQWKDWAARKEESHNSEKEYVYFCVLNIIIVFIIDYCC